MKSLLLLVPVFLLLSLTVPATDASAISVIFSDKGVFKRSGGIFSKDFSRWEKAKRAHKQGKCSVAEIRKYR